MVEPYLDTPKNSGALVPRRHRLPRVAEQDAASARPMVVATPVSCVTYVPNQSLNILRLPDVMKRVGLKHAAIYLRITKGSFPRQISLGGRAVGWIESEIDAWLQSHVSARNEVRQIATSAQTFLPLTNRAQGVPAP